MKLHLWWRRESVVSLMGVVVFLLTPAVVAAVCPIQLVGSTLYAGTLPPSGTDEAWGIVVDGSGNVVVAGNAQTPGGTLGTIRKYDPALGTVLASTTVMGFVYAMARDSGGNIVVAGGADVAGTWSLGVWKFDASLGTLLASTLYLAPGGFVSNASAVTTDAGGNIYAAGIRQPGGNDCLVVKFDPTLTTILGSTVYDAPGSNDSQALGIVVDSGGPVFVVGSVATAKTDHDWMIRKYDSGLSTLMAATTYTEAAFAVADQAFDAVIAGGGLVVVGSVYVGGTIWGIRKYDLTLSSVLASTRFGDFGTAVPNAVAVSGTGDIAVAGYEPYGGANDWRLNVYDSGFTTVRSVRWGSPDMLFESAYSVAFDATGGLYVAGDYAFGSGPVWGITHFVPLSGCLEGSFAVSPDTRVAGQWMQASLALTNPGTGAVNTLAPFIQANTGGTAVAQIGTANPPDLLALAAGASTVFTWTFSASGRGAVEFTATVTGIDPAFSIAVSAVGSATVTCLAAARLEAALACVPSVAKPVVGQVFIAVLTVTNTGDVNATAVAPAIEANVGGTLVDGPGDLTPPPPVTIAAGAHVHFTWSCTVAGAGTVALTATAFGTGAVVNNVLVASSSRAQVTYAPGALVSAISLSPSTAATGAEVGRLVTLIFTVTNEGGVSVSGVTATIYAGPGGGLVSPLVGPVPAGPATMPAGSEIPFVWTFTVTGAGAVTFTASVSGIDTSTSLPVTISSIRSIVTEVPAQLAAAISINPSLPAQAGVGSVVTVDLTVTNTGGVAALGVSPAYQLYKGTTLVALRSGPTPAGPLSIAAGASQVFRWTFSVTGAGTVGITVTGTGQDEGTAVVLAAASSSDQLQAAYTAVIRAEVEVSPSPAVLSSRVKVIVRAHNDGTVAAAGVAPSAPSVGPGADLVALEASPAAGAITVNAYDVAAWTWVYAVKGGGTVTFTTTVTGGGGALTSTASASVVITTVSDTKLPEPGTVQVRNNILNVTRGTVACVVLRGKQGGGTADVWLYSRAGLPLARIGTGPVVLDGAGLALVEFDGVIDGKPLATGAYWVIVTGAVKDKRQIIVVHEK